MFHRLLLLVLFVFLLIPVCAAALEPGQSAPQLTLPSRNGEELSLSALRGKVVYLDFWATWCGPCRKSFPVMSALREKFASRGFEVLAVSVDKKRESVDKFLADVPAAFPVLLDPAGETPKRFSLKTMPSSYLIGRDGTLLASFEGFHGESAEEIEMAITQALEAK